MKARVHFDAKGQALAHAGADQSSVLAVSRGVPGWAQTAVVHGYLSQRYGLLDVKANGAGWRERMRAMGVTRMQVGASGELLMPRSGGAA